MTGNCGWGIWAISPLSINGGGLIQNNGKGCGGGGIHLDAPFPSGGISLTNLQVLDNDGPGIQVISSAYGTVLLDGIQVRNNTGVGIQSASDLVIKGTGNVVSHNGRHTGDGIFASGDKVEIQTAIQIDDNCGWGIYATSTIAIEAGATIRNNGWRCSTGGGVHGDQQLDAANLVVTGSYGWGVETKGDARISTGQLCGNGSGDLYTDGQAFLSGVILGGDCPVTATPTPMATATPTPTPSPPTPTSTWTPTAPTHTTTATATPPTAPYRVTLPDMMKNVR